MKRFRSASVFVVPHSKPCGKFRLKTIHARVSMSTPVEARAEIVDQPFPRVFLANSAGKGLSLLQVGFFGFEPNHICPRRKCQRS
jgi:hypothetical protein